MERSPLEAPCAGGSRYFFSSWSYEDRLFLHQLYRRCASAGVHCMQENAASCGNRDNRSQWPLWHFLALEWRSSLDRSASPKQIEQFFREVDGVGVGPDKLDSLLFPRVSPTSTSDDGTAAEISETKDGLPPNVGWAETEVDAPQSQECSEKQASDAGRVVGMTESPSAEVTLVSKDGRRASNGAVDAVTVPINTDMLPAADPTDSESVFPENDALDDQWALLGEDPVVDNKSTGNDVALTRRRASACDVYDVAGGDNEEGAPGSPVFHDGAATKTEFGDRQRSDAGENGYSTDDDTPWSALDSVDSEAQFTANSVDKETQCEFDADFMPELLSAETALRMEVVGLGMQLRKMQVHTGCKKSGARARRAPPPLPPARISFAQVLQQRAVSQTRPTAIPAVLSPSLVATSYCNPQTVGVTAVGSPTAPVSPMTTTPPLTGVDVTTLTPTGSPKDEMRIREMERSLPSHFPRRPTHGKLGRPIQLVANHFSIEIHDGYVYHYNVEIYSETSARAKVPEQKKSRHS